ncbi:Alpha,alpha-trehalose-phosphate synthase [UDP-forming] 2 [Caenorhabditis elegans]|uniref:Alpha,alpha-trehalose-phosphate synthase [UDP-forming] 2 n=2 Tax=Caenorhabditis elegans TaxID=6239 RepID=TPS2_CAEEL|nr:Alpha,alpha-trehalose-phosphate synthase [UDP-forming] 2 [Caenorhabditis elegans]O45380.3 RecName: Full=Alpha,alpha-trehalose-phosphate synthase [UDP-forming] 2; AltName: Full=Trehalose-6-phosphate synthase 2; AltName: Full=UDP-glucose-glucosephosphate glucosyltransferase 2 [Caenorhabditis elegans]CAB07584.3 Alpha,alpha-trehalose-phosphate synthase [UDP-forming] 2 [Caenorhabditis elegans]CAH18872.1 putative trehalose 6-phosphate synthase [Caenorhabditis elegans]|eukprot:NP_497035.3 Alpha,alpha-trehalose-phosphate synthase [UDP-forming] 2 [Caenorhabditis elegans]
MGSEPPPSEKKVREPFSRAMKDVQISDEQRLKELWHLLDLLEIEYKKTADLHTLISSVSESLTMVWKRRDPKSELALKGLLLILEYCLSHVFDGHAVFEIFVSSLGFNTVIFWKHCAGYIFDSDLGRGTKFRDALLFSLTLYDVNTGKNRLRELYAAVPGIRKSLLGVNAKQFGERYHHLQKRLARYGSHTSLCSVSSDSEGEEAIHNVRSGTHTESESEEDPKAPRSGLATSHFQQRVINVSNAPPVSLKREKTGDWEIKQGSGGLVACVDPVMSKDHENLWLANLGMNINDKKQKRPGSVASIPESFPSTNTLGLPLIKQTIAEVFFHVLADDDMDAPKNEKQKKAREEMSLLGVLNNYNRGNYKLNPVVVQEDDYNVYYGGISNGLLWPALHNLPEYIVSEYDDEKILRAHWCAYVRVNYQFAIDAVRNSRPQDFIWIHDYHLMLVGMIMQSLDQHLEVGFFLHIPFQPPGEFFSKYSTVGFAVLRGLLRFTKVGFQTHRDRTKYIELVQHYFGTAKIVYDNKMDIYSITNEGWTCSLGVFPVSIKNDDFLKFVDLPETIKLKNDLRKRVMGDTPAPDGRFFFSVERFDYTKGIMEKLQAYKRYFERHPDRIGKDVLFQIAVTNRRSVDTYRVYQDECIDLADKINEIFKDPNNPTWKPLVFQTDGLPRSELVAAYLAMDIGVVTPKKDGMNLVAKEMLVCNPKAGLVLSTGAGSEIQFTTAGLYSDKEKNYHRISNVFDPDSYCDAFYSAALEPEDVRAEHGKRLHEFIMANDIERWSCAFLDPSWTHEVIRPTQVETLDDFFSLMMKTRNVRRQIVGRVLKGIPIRSHFAISLRNAKESLEQICKPGTHTAEFKSGPDSKEVAHFEIDNELQEFERDLSFIDYVQSDDADNVEQFVDTLISSHPISVETYKKEVENAVELLYSADHFHYFFTDRDGTLKSYSCSYPSSIQPAYSGVIQAQFARRCAQTCVILTTAPLMHIGVLDVSTIPNGYYYFGASGGREWFIDNGHNFKDESILKGEKADVLASAYTRISHLLEEPEFRPFTWVGSGLQKHYGHLTIAFQDVYKTITEAQGKQLHEEIEKIVKDVDPHGTRLQLASTEFDIKVYMKTETDGHVFDKGDGLRLLCEKMHCDLTEGNVLVCGDSSTDIPMLKECLIRNPKGVYTIWVTVNDKLKEEVRALCASYSNSNVAFVSCPEVLLGAMAQATIREITITRTRKMSRNIV